MSLPFQPIKDLHVGHYRGVRILGECFVCKWVEGRYVTLDPRYDLRRHSPAGFNWGYGGSGPAQLSLALAADALGNGEKAQRVYQRFKQQVISTITCDEWVMIESDVRRGLQLLHVDWMLAHPYDAPCAYECAVRDGRIGASGETIL